MGITKAMSKKILTFMVFLGAVFLLAPQIHASGGHVHSHDHGSISPFDKHQGETSLHCLLKGHQMMLNCPHTRLDDTESNRTFMIVADCSDPVSSLPAKYGPDQTFTQSSFYEINPWIPSQRIHLSQSFFTQFLPHPLDHPPQL
ncbi:MAG: hypothetical protein ACQ9MH_05275 [Nitrospinales bacterium]